MGLAITAAAHAYHAQKRSPFILGLLRDVIERRTVAETQENRRAVSESHFDVLA